MTLQTVSRDTRGKCLLQKGKNELRMIMFTSPILCEVRMSSLTHVLSRKTLPHAILVWAYVSEFIDGHLTLF